MPGWTDVRSRTRAGITKVRAVPPAELFLIAAIIGLAVLVRFIGRHEVTPDMRLFYRWIDEMRELGGYRSLSEEIGNYNAPFNYLLVLAIYLPGATLIKIKGIFIAFDLLMAFFTYRIVALRYAGWRIPLLAAMVVVLLPTVVVNASLYGQDDSVWAAFALGGLYYLLRDRPWLAVVMCTTAYAFKPQGIFIFPLLFLALLAGRLRVRHLLAGPVTYLLWDLPALLLGRDPVELLTIYTRQVDQTPALTRNGPSVFAYLPVTTRIETLRGLGYAFAALLVVAVCYLLIASRVRLDRQRFILAATLFSIGVPYLLPGMHERYFYLGDVLTVVVAFYLPRLWYLPLVIQVASGLSYLPFLFSRTRHGDFVSLDILATFMLAGLLITGYTLLHDLRAPVSRRTDDPPTAAEPPPGTPPAEVSPATAQRPAEASAGTPAGPGSSGPGSSGHGSSGHGPGLSRRPPAGQPASVPARPA